MTLLALSNFVRNIRIPLGSRYKAFCYTNKIICLNRERNIVTTTKCLVLSTKRLVAAAKFLVAATKKIVVPNFVAVTKPFFSVLASDFWSSDLGYF